MIEETELQPDERILLLEIPAAEDIRRLAVRLSRGLLVVIGDDERVRTARRELADLDNVMLLPAPVTSEIPWRDQFFTTIFAPVNRAATPEMSRVLAPGGRIYLKAPDPA